MGPFRSVCQTEDGAQWWSVYRARGHGLSPSTGVGMGSGEASSKARRLFIRRFRSLGRLRQKDQSQPLPETLSQKTWTNTSYSEGHFGADGKSSRKQEAGRQAGPPCTAPWGLTTDGTGEKPETQPHIPPAEPFALMRGYVCHKESAAFSNLPTQKGGSFL